MRIQTQLWNRGNLTLQDYSLLSLNPELVRLLAGSQSLGEYLQAKLDTHAQRRLNALDLWHDTMKYAPYPRQLQLLQDYQAAGRLGPYHLTNLILDNNFDLFQEGLKYIAPIPDMLGTAFYNHRFEFVELLMAAPYNFVPSFEEVIAGGRVEDLARFGYADAIIRQEVDLESLAFSSAAMVALWAAHHHQDPNFESQVVQVCDHVIAIGESQSVPVLTYIVRQLPHGARCLRQAIDANAPSFKMVDELFNSELDPELIGLIVEAQLQE